MVRKIHTYAEMADKWQSRAHPERPMETICEEETGTRLTANSRSSKQLARGSFLDSFNGWRGRDRKSVV